MMHEYPYTNFHDLNADWIVDQLGDLKDSKEAAAASATAAAASETAAAESATAAAASEESAQNNAELIQNAADQLELLNARVENLVSANTGTKVNTVRVSNIYPENGVATATFNVPEGYGILEALTKVHGTDTWTTGCGINEYNNVITLTLSTTAITDFMLIYSSTEAVTNAEVVDIRTGYDGTIYTSAGDAVRGQVGDLKNALNSVATIVSSINLFNGEYDTGYIVTNGSITVDANYTCSKIQILPAGSYLFKYSSVFGSNATRCYRYQTDGVTLKDIVYGTDLGDNICKVDLDSWSYCRFNIGEPSTPATWMIVKGDTADDYPSAYYPYGYESIEINEDVNIPTYNRNPLYEKKLCCDGDSIMYGAGFTGGFAKIIAEANNMTVQNIAVSGGTIRSGTTWSGGGNRHWICESIETLDTDGDYYLFDGGVNDVNSQTVMGTISWGYESTLDTTTFCGAFEQCCKILATKYAGKKVGYVFVHRIWKPTDTLLQSFLDNMVTILKKWGIPYINLMELDPPINDIAALKSAYTNNSDGWHPNEEGYRLFYVDKITAWLKTL